MLTKILLHAAISRSSPTKNNSLDVYRGLASVCRQWRDVIESDHFRQKYFKYIASRKNKEFESLNILTNLIIIINHYYH